MNLGMLSGRNDDEDHSRTLEQAAEHLASAMMWNLWPLLIDSRDIPARMNCHVTVDGADVPVPLPDDEACIRPFVDAYRTLPTSHKVIRRQRPATDIGRFAVSKNIAPMHVTRATLAAPFEGNAHHCARMREPRLVVDYLPGPPLTNQAIHYGAVFLADKIHDKVFADSEPPTHDDWVAEKLDKAQDKDARSIVRRAGEELKKELQLFADEYQGTSLQGGKQPPLGALSGRLAALIPAATGPGADGDIRGHGGSGTGAGSDPSPVQFIDPPHMTRLEDSARIVAEFRVKPSNHIVSVQVLAEVALDHGKETEAPVGADVPVVLQLRGDDGTIIDGDAVDVGPDDARIWTVIVRPAAGAAAKLRLVSR